MRLFHFMLNCRNGRRSGLKIRCLWRMGSNPIFSIINWIDGLKGKFKKAVKTWEGKTNMKVMLNHT